MPKGPHGEKRPADVIGNAVKVMRIAMGEEEEVLPSPAKKKHPAKGTPRRRARSSASDPARPRQRPSGSASCVIFISAASPASSW
jgi:hypothetical protein